MSIFSQYNDILRSSIVHQIGFNELRPIQELSGKAILKGKNVIIIAQTAGGKTEAAFFPILSNLIGQTSEGVKCIYISPLKALLNNQEERLDKYFRMVGLSVFKWHGDISLTKRKQLVKEPTDLLMITPESIEVMFTSKYVPIKKMFRNLQYIVIDEIHYFAECDRGSHLLVLMERLRAYSDFDFQRIGLSATVGNTDEILNWMCGASNNIKEVIAPLAKPSKKQIKIQYDETGEIFKSVAKDAMNCNSLFFCRSRKRTEEIAATIGKEQLTIYTHHSSISRERRELAEQKIQLENSSCIVCTSTLELGVDIGHLDKIFQEECPTTVSSFLQRLGRTGRREGKKMNYTFLTTSEQSMLVSIALVELAIDKWVEDVKCDYKAWHILLFQIMTICLQYGAISRTKIWQKINNASCFKKIKEQDFHYLVDYLKGKDFLFEEPGYISMGTKAEKTFGRRNFMKLFSVMSSIEEYIVVTVGGKEIGTLAPDFADTLEKFTCIQLAGKPWMIERIELKEKKIVVNPAPKGIVPRWTSIFTDVLSYEVCRKVYDTLVSNNKKVYLDKKALECLLTLRMDREFLKKEFAPISFDQNDNENNTEYRPSFYWWTFAGRKINFTLQCGLSFLKFHGKIDINNFFIRANANEKDKATIANFVTSMKENGFWDNFEFKKHIVKMLPNHRLSKFQIYLPIRCQVEMLVGEFLDIDGTKRFLTEINL